MAGGRGEGRAARKDSPDEAKTPLYVRLAEEIEGAMLRGEYRAGDKLPAERALSERCRVSRHTVGQAMNYLQNKGLIQRSRGRGTFVRPDRLDFKVSSEQFRFTDATESLGLAASRRVLSVRRVRAHARLASKMCIGSGEPLTAVELVRLAGKIPLRYGTGYLRERLFPGIHALLDGRTWSVPELLREHYGVERYFRARAVFDVEPADLETSHHLAVPLGSAVLRAESLDTLEDGTPTLLTISYFRADAVKMHVKLREVKAEG